MNIDILFHRGLSLEKLRAFLEVARSESVTAAAKGIPSRRSLMSRQIGELELTLGIELFSRRGRSLRITEAGRELALITAAYFAEFETVVGRFLRSQQTLRLGAGASVLETLLFPRMTLWEQGFPGILFEFVPTSTNVGVQKLHEGQIDLAVLRSGLNAPGLFEIPSCSISFCLVGRRDCGVRMDDCTVSEFFRRVPLTVIRGQGQWLESLRRLCDSLGVVPSWSHRVETFGHVRELLKSGAAGGVLPSQLALELDPSTFKIIQDPSLEVLSRSLSVYHDSRSARVRDRLSIWASQLSFELKNSAS